MKYMKPPDKLPNLVNMSYPRIVQPVYGEKIFIKEGNIYDKAGSLALKNFSEYTKLTLDWYIEGQYNGSKIFLEDCMLLEHYEAELCPWVYTIRLQKLRHILTDEICAFDKFIDIPSDLVYSGAEALELYKGYGKPVLLKDPNAQYSWETVTEKTGEVLLLKASKE